MASPVAAMSGVPITLQNAQTTGGGAIIAIPPSFRNHTIIITGSAGVASGAVQPETSNDPTFATATEAAEGGGPVTVLANTEIVVHLTGLINFFRVRISTTITGGTVTVVYTGAKSY